MYGKKSLAERIFGVANIILLTALCATMILPLLNVVAISFSSNNAAMRGDVSIWPVQFTTAAYKYIVNFRIIFDGYKNSLFLVTVGTVINVLLTIITAYPLSRKTLIGRRWFMTGIVFTMMFSGGLIPSYLLMMRLKLLNNIWSLILPGAISAYNLIIMKNFFESLPQELIEAARVDGLTEIGIIVRIVIPLSMAVIATVTLFYAVTHWNSYFNAAIYLNKKSVWPLQLVLRDILFSASMAGANEGMDVTQAIPLEPLKMAVVVVATAPILCVYPFVQRYFVKGVIMGAIKG